MATYAAPPMQPVHDPVSSQGQQPQYQQHQPAPSHAQSQNRGTASIVNDWNTGTYECQKDEETCWWGSWCCCLLSARNAAAFDVGSSPRQAWGFITFLIVVYFISMILPPIGLLLLLSGLAGYAYYRADLRAKMREKLGIPGQFFSDFNSHFFCPCCTIAQEGREAKFRGMKRLDFISGEELNTIAFPQVGGSAVPESGAPNVPSAVEEDGDYVSDSLNMSLIASELKQVSQLSTSILYAWLTIIVFTFISLIVRGRGQNVLVLFLVFVQPLAILYFVYWRGENRRHASMDYVIKLFAVGFFMSTTQSIVFESILELLMGIAVAIAIAIVNPSSTSDTTSDNDEDKKKMLVQLLMPMVEKTGSWLQLLSDMFGNKIDSDMNATSSSSMPMDHYYTHSNSIEGDSAGYGFHTTTADADGGGGGTSSTDDGFTPHQMRQNFVIVVIALFTMAFVIAAGVEETMKHFAVRCCPFPAPLRDPQAVLVYLMTAALGFATSENIEYVFGTNRSPLPGTSILVGELFVLLIRICMPIHVICSVLQATNLSKRLMGDETMNLFRILLPAVLLHGSFDFVLFLFGSIQYAYEVKIRSTYLPAHLITHLSLSLSLYLSIYLPIYLFL